MAGASHVAAYLHVCSGVDTAYSPVCVTKLKLVTQHSKYYYTHNMLDVADIKTNVLEAALVEPNIYSVYADLSSVL